MKKYCLFEGGDIVGPFPAGELITRAGFGAHSLVCPEGHCEEETYWKQAACYEEFDFTGAAPAVKQTDKMPETAAAGCETVQTPADTDTETDTATCTATKEETVLQESTETATPVPAASETTDTQPVSTQETPAQDATSTVQTAAADAPKTETISSELTVEETAPQPSIQTTEAATQSDIQLPLIPPRAQEATSVQKAAEPPTLPPLPAAAAETDSIPLAAVPAQETAASQLSPIEEYFNTMQDGDLGNILGIPDPKTNSDLDFDKVLKKQMERTDPSSPKPITDTFDELVPNRAEPAGPATPDESDRKTEAQLRQDLSNLQTAAVLPLGEKMPAETAAGQPLAAQQSQDTDLQTGTSISAKQENTAQGTAAVSTNPETHTGQETVGPAERVAALRSKSSSWGGALRTVGGEMYWLAIAAMIACVIGGWLLLSYRQAVGQQTVGSVPVAAAPVTRVNTPVAAETELPSGPALAAAPVEAAKTPEEQAKEIVQSYTLDQNRGSVADYLAKRYAKELANGYAGVWAAEPLHRDVYVVKYRLAKARKEPIVYVFQADTAKKKLTGALNNITLDLVGKINS